MQVPIPSDEAGLNICGRNTFHHKFEGNRAALSMDIKTSRYRTGLDSYSQEYEFLSKPRKSAFSLGVTRDVAVKPKPDRVLPTYHTQVWVQWFAGPIRDRGRCPALVGMCFLACPNPTQC